MTVPSFTSQFQQILLLDLEIKKTRTAHPALHRKNGQNRWKMISNEPHCSYCSDMSETAGALTGSCILSLELLIDVYFEFSAKLHHAYSGSKRSYLRGLGCSSWDCTSFKIETIQILSVIQHEKHLTRLSIWWNGLSVALLTERAVDGPWAEEVRRRVENAEE